MKGGSNVKIGCLFVALENDYWDFWGIFGNFGSRFRVAETPTYPDRQDDALG
jgi:hypothetical protein